MAIKSKWTVLIQSLRVCMRVGVHPHEYDPQPVLVTLKVSGMTDSAPTSIDHCVDYDPLVKWLTETLPQLPRAGLLETRLNDIAQFVFSTDKRILGVWVGLYKAEAFANLALVGVEKEMSRRQFEEMQRKPRLRPPASAPAAKRVRKQAAA